MVYTTLFRLYNYDIREKGYYGCDVYINAALEVKDIDYLYGTDSNKAEERRYPRAYKNAMNREIDSAGARILVDAEMLDMKSRNYIPFKEHDGYYIHIDDESQLSEAVANKARETGSHIIIIDMPARKALRLMMEKLGEKAKKRLEYKNSGLLEDGETLNDVKNFLERTDNKIHAFDRVDDATMHRSFDLMREILKLAKEYPDVIERLGE